MERSRTLAIVGTLVFGACFVGALRPMVERVRAFNAEAGLARFHAEVLNARRTQIGVFPEFSLTDVPGQGPRGEFESFLRLEYAGREVMIPVKRPPAFDVANLGMYEEWVKALAVNRVEPGPQTGAATAVPGTEQLLIVARRTPDGYDPESWGSVRRDDWVFDFYRLMPDGEVRVSQRRWPRGRRAEARLAEETGNPLREIEPLTERTIEYFAAMHVIPKLNVPRHKFDDTALSPAVLGWTLPVSMLGLLGFTASLVFVIAPKRRRE